MCASPGGCGGRDVRQRYSVRWEGQVLRSTKSQLACSPVCSGDIIRAIFWDLTKRSKNPHDWPDLYVWKRRMQHFALTLNILWVLLGFHALHRKPSFTYRGTTNEWVDKQNEQRHFYTGHKGSLNGVMNIKTMWIICCGLHSHNISTKHPPMGDFGAKC